MDRMSCLQVSTTLRMEILPRLDQYSEEPMTRSEKVMEILDTYGQACSGFGYRRCEETGKSILQAVRDSLPKPMEQHMGLEVTKEEVMGWNCCLRRMEKKL